MAEALGAAGSIAGLVGLAGQIAQGVLFLHGFFSDIRDAPEEIRDLRAELDQYRRLYERLESYLSCLNRVMWPTTPSMTFKLPWFLARLGLTNWSVQLASTVWRTGQEEEVEGYGVRSAWLSGNSGIGNTWQLWSEPNQR
jgi:hypothetical protein